MNETERIVIKTLQILHEDAESGTSAAYTESVTDLLACVNQNNQYRQIHYGQSIARSGKMHILLQRMIRRSLRFLIQPIIDEQNRLNNSMVESINIISATLSDVLPSQNGKEGNR